MIPRGDLAPDARGIDPVIAQALALGQGSVGPIGQTQSVSAPQAPFTWGAGGRKLTPQQLAFEQKLAASKSQSDYSPVSNIWQGLGRVTDNITGALESRSLDRQSAQMQADRDAQIAALLGPANADLAGAFTGGDEVAASLAGDIFKQRNPKPAQPHYWETNNGSLGMIGADGLPNIVYNDPTPKIDWIQAKDPNTGQITLIPMQQGSTTQPGGVPSAPVGKLTPLGGPTPPASGGFR